MAARRRGGFLCLGIFDKVGSSEVIKILRMFRLFYKIQNNIKYRVDHHQPGLYLYILFPISFAFLLTFTLARIFNYWFPSFYIPWSSSFTEALHVHHFTYGFFILAAAGYLSLVHDGPKAKYLISWLYGFGLGLAMDEFGIWIKLIDSDPTRWSYDGFLIFIGAIILILSAKPGAKLIKNLWPFE